MTAAGGWAAQPGVWRTIPSPAGLTSTPPAGRPGEHRRPPEGKPGGDGRQRPPLVLSAVTSRHPPIAIAEHRTSGHTVVPRKDRRENCSGVPVKTWTLLN